jgi:hypothetical protein
VLGEEAAGAVGLVVDDGIEWSAEDADALGPFEVRGWSGSPAASGEPALVHAENASSPTRAAAATLPDMCRNYLAAR